MLKKKLLFSLVIIQGILILVGIIAIIFGIFYKYNNQSSIDKINHHIDLGQIFLLDENYYQQKIIENNHVIFQIIEIGTNKIKKEIIID